MIYSYYVAILHDDNSIYTSEREKFWVSEGYEVNSYTEPVLSED